ncbi:protein IQ-DOMAIN 19-like [Lolium rigidum]|uniref:protein IQ-DOMAIN 19-like n=1 Tax=Lolium rigidum TaxID=89674 RepID=UPI001F5D688E|nr:protein IQ-DOMAIN 19-like [Lolium rigidum]
MGKAARWLRSFLTGKKGKGKARGGDGGPLPSLPAPAAKEKRRWSFRRPASSVSGRDTISTASGYQGHGRQLASTSSSHCFSADVHVVATAVQEDQLEHAAVPVPPLPAEAAIVAAPENGGNAEEAAAVRIQSAFRSYLARKALCALRGMVKLQAMVRGQLVRRQADATLRRIQALVAAQRRARAERLRLRLLEDGGAPASRRSPQHYLQHRSPRKTVAEADGARHSSCCSTPGKGDPYSRHNHRASPSPATRSENTSARTFSERFEEEHYSASAASFSAAGSEASWRHHRGGGKACHAHAGASASASYMANTESSRAKQARSQSAPRHRPEPASPSPSGRRRASLDPRDLAAGQVGQARAPSPGRSSVDARGAREAER